MLIKIREKIPVRSGESLAIYSFNLMEHGDEKLKNCAEITIQISRKR